MSDYVKHTNCPKCLSRDNLAVYSDGHKYCFGCKYYEGSPDTIANLQRKLYHDSSGKGVSGINTEGYTYKIPTKALTWLKKYGITEHEVHFFNLMWNPERESLVFPVINGNGEVKLTSERYFGDNPKHPKYVTQGMKNNNNTLFKHSMIKDCVVLVEDFVSAMKVMRHCNSVCLFGCNIPENTLKWVTGRFKRAAVWLDFNKASESLREASRLSQYIDATSIVTELDPKEYSNNEISLLMKQHRLIS